jgi:hypothetical protein
MTPYEIREESKDSNGHAMITGEMMNARACGCVVDGWNKKKGEKRGKKGKKRQLCATKTREEVLSWNALLGK